MNCCWCGANADDSGSHGICDTCMSVYFGVNPVEVHQSEFDAIPSYVETQAAQFVQECDELLRQEQAA